MKLIAVILAALVVTAMEGCTTLRSGEFSYSSTKDVEASGLLVIVEYYENGSKKSVHVEIGHLITETEIDTIISAAIKAALLAAGVP